MEKEIVLTKLERQLLMYDIFFQCTVIAFVEITNLLPINKKMIERDIKDLTDAGLISVAFSKKENGYIHSGKPKFCETAREIQTAIFQSPAYYPELLQCSEVEKEECLKTVVCLYRLWDCLRQQGGLALFVPNAPLLDACFDFPEHDIDGILYIKEIFRQCMETEGFGGGRFLNNAVAAEGVLLYLRFPEKAYSMSRAQWGQKLCDAVKGLFGPDFENRVEACVEREAKMHISLDEEIPFVSLSIDWPKAENRKIEEKEALKTAAKIFRIGFDAADKDAKPENAAPDCGNEEYGEDSLKGQMIAKAFACLRQYPTDPERLCCTMKSMLGLEYVNQVDQIFKNERKAYRKRKRRDTLSVVSEFDTLAKLSPDACARILAEIPENTLVYAFKGAGDEVEDLLWRSLPEKMRQEVEEDLDIVVNVRLKDVEEAQRAILEKTKYMFGEMLE